MLFDEPDGPELHIKLKRANQRYISGMVIYETVTALMRVNVDNQTAIVEIVDSFVKRHAFNFIDIDRGVTKLAVEAFAKFGKGRHSAKLNMGDCFAYACAKSINAPLLFKGSDFGQTDIEIA